MVHTPARPAFRQRVLGVVRRIPAGRVATYGDVAEAAGAPGAARAVGNIMRDCHDATVPCHRVVAAGGGLGGYGGRESMKRALLEAEGIRVRGRRLAAFAEVRWSAATRGQARAARHHSAPLEPRWR